MSILIRGEGGARRVGMKGAAVNHGLPGMDWLQ